MTDQLNNLGILYSDGTQSYSLNRFERAIFGYGLASAGFSAVTNIVTNTGVVGTDVAGVGTARDSLAAAGFGGDRAIFGYGYIFDVVSMTNLVSHTFNI